MAKNNAIFVRCGKCNNENHRVIIQKEGMTFTCAQCDHLVLFIKKGKFDPLINGLIKNAASKSVSHLRE